MLNLFFLLVTVLLASVSAHAESDKKAINITSGINLYGVTFQHGSPPWLKRVTDDQEILKASKFFKDQKGPKFIYEAIPADETFEAWKTIYVVKALKNIQKMPLSKWEFSNLTIFRQVCPDVQIEYLVMGAKVSLVQVVCQKILNYSQDGYDKGMGEVGLFVFMKQDDVLISHYTEWRGEAFTYRDRKSWPVTEGQLQEGIVNMKKAKAIGQKSIVTFGK